MSGDISRDSGPMAGTVVTRAGKDEQGWQFYIPHWVPVNLYYLEVVARFFALFCMLMQDCVSVYACV